MIIMQNKKSLKYKDLIQKWSDIKGNSQLYYFESPF